MSVYQHVCVQCTLEGHDYLKDKMSTRLWTEPREITQREVGMDGAPRRKATISGTRGQGGKMLEKIANDTPLS